MEYAMNRRKFLTITGGGVILAAGAGVGGLMATSTPHKALKPWRDAGSLYTEPRKRALSYAILAPNSHNRQPWKIDLSVADEITILPDTDRMLPHTDPINRQITIGFGCFLEILRMAAAGDGYRVDEVIFPQGVDETSLDARPVAKLKLTADPTVKPDPLFAHVLARRSLKEPYDLTRSISDKDLQTISSETSQLPGIGATNDPAKVKELRKLTRQALKLELDVPRTYEESVHLFRLGKKEIEANPDGIHFSGPMYEVLIKSGLFTREAALDRNSSAYTQGINTVLASTDTAMAYVWIVTKTNTRSDQITAGRQWVRINLAATGLGIATHPLSQALQEYPEMEPYYKKIHQMLAPGGATVQMFARLGYGDSISETPRWGLAEKILVQ